MDVNIEKISNTTKNIIFLVMLVVEAAWVVFMVYANKEAIITTDARSEKRYKRGMKMGTDHEQRI